MSPSSTEVAPQPPGWQAWLESHVGVGLLVAAIAIVLDQATKRLAFLQLQPQGRLVEVPGPVDLVLTFNDGGAFGLPAPAWLFGLVTVVVVGLVARVLPKVPTTSLAVAYGLLLGGALGNAIDRLLADPPIDEAGFFNGVVTDFFKLIRIGGRQFPIFNVADVAITVGFVVLVVAMYAEERREEERAAEAARAEAAAAASGSAASPAGS